MRGIFGRRLWENLGGAAVARRVGRFDLALITHRLALCQLPEAIELLDGEAGKVLLDPALESAAT